MTDGHRKKLAALAIAIVVIFSVAVGWFLGVPMIRLARDPAQFQAMVDSWGVGSRAIFVGMVVLQVVVALIPGEPMELAAGYAFGFWEGTALTMAGFLIGSALIFALVRRFGVKLVEVFFSMEKITHFSFLKNPQKTKTLAFLLMLIPGTPKDFLSYFAGLTNLTWKTWLLIVAVGRLPSLITSVATGAAAGEQHYGLSVTILALTLLMTLGGIVYYRHICKKEQE